MLAIAWQATSVFACDEIGISKSILSIGVQGDDAYFTLVEGFQCPTQWGLVYIDLSTPGGRAALAKLEIAKALSSKVVRVAYDTNPGGMSMLSIIQTE